jgi:hypothetical protein
MTIAAGSDALAADFIATSAGAGSSGQVPKLNASGKLDGTFINGAVGLKRNSGGPNTSSNVDLDTISITGLNANDIIVIYYTLSAVAGTSTGAITLANNTNSVSLGDIGLTYGVAAGDTLTGQVFLTCGGDSTARFLLNSTYGNAANTGATDTTSRQRFVSSTGNTAGFTGTWTLALHKGTDSGTCSLYWRWYAYKLIS